jgi:hypothetical protein
MNKTKERTTVRAVHAGNGLDIYLNIAGSDYYLTSRRCNGLLYRMLKNGKTVRKLSQIKPTSTKVAQKRYHYALYLLKTIDDYFKYELAV